MVVLGGRAPQQRWGAGSLQELDHVPIVASVAKRAATATSAASIVEEVDAACRAARTPHRGPAFVDIPLDVVRSGGRRHPRGRPGCAPGRGARSRRRSQRVAKLVGEAARPVLVAGGDVYWAHAEGALRAFAEAARVPVFVNGMGRGHAARPTTSSRSRGRGRSR